MDAKHQEKLDELVSAMAAEIRIDAERLYNSGMIDVTRFDPDQYPLVKVLLTAAARRNANNYAPPANNPKLVADVKNLLCV